MPPSTGFGSFGTPVDSAGQWPFLRSRWSTSRWLASERAASWGATQLYLIVAGALLGPAAFGGLKAAQGLVIGPTIVVINAGGSFGLPEASRQLDEAWLEGHGESRPLRHRGQGSWRRPSVRIAVLVAAPTLLRLLYGPAVRHVRTRAPGSSPSPMVVSAFAVGPILTLTATRRVRPLFVVQLAKLVVSVAAVLC